MKMLRSATLVLLLTLCCLPDFSSAQAACSNVQGRATINELYRGASYFAEVKLLDPGLSINGWTLTLCTAGFNPGCVTLPLTSAQSFGPYLILDQAPLSRDRLDFSKDAMDVLLRDASGNAVDYLRLNGHSVQGGACSAYPYATVLNGNTNSFSVIRNPDGTGPWQFFGSGNSQDQTPGAANVAHPSLSGSNLTVPRGVTAQFLLTLDRPALGGERFSYQTVDDSATAGTHFESRSGSITFAAGATSATISVPTLESSPPPDGIYFWLNLTSPSGLNLNSHWLRGTIAGGLESVHHYRLLHDGSALTCQSEEVTVLACMNAECTSLYNGEVSLTLSPSGWVGGNSKTFSGGTAIYRLRRNTPGTTTLGIATASPNATAQCRSGGGESCALVFHETGFVFDIPNALACEESPAISIQAVRMDQTSQACTAADSFAGSTRTISFWSDYQEPVSGPTPLWINGTPIAAAQPGTAIPLSFDAQARALISTSYEDVGRLQLNARYLGSGEETGLVLVGSDIFSVKPARFDILATSDGTHALNNATSTGSPFWPAGEDFQVEVRAVCDDGTPTPNFAAPVHLAVIAPFAPADGVLGQLENGLIDAAAFSGGSAVRNEVRYTEVGLMTLQATTLDYLGSGAVSGTSGLIGRFTPHHFAVIPNTPEFEPACDNGGFTYMGQPFHYSLPPVLNIEARNKQDLTTLNYKNDWWKLTHLSLGTPRYDSAQGTLDLGLLPANEPLIEQTGGGSGSLSFSSGGGMAFLRPATPENPFAAEISLSIDVLDADGIAYPGNPARFGTPTEGGGMAFVPDPDSGESQNFFRYGRLNLHNAYGPEILPLTIPLRVEVFEGGYFMTHGADSCTMYSHTLAGLSHFQNLAEGDTSPSGEGRVIQGTLDPGHPLRLSAPNKAGHLTLTLGTVPWLQFDWNNDGSETDPQARATFGIYEGNPRKIFTREILP